MRIQTQNPITASAVGYQKIEINQTEAITGDEALGLKYFHVMGRLFDVGADTTVEVHYLSRRGDLILLKANESIYGTGGFVPLSLSDKEKKYATRIKIGGKVHTISLDYLASLILNPASGGLTRFSTEFSTSTALASDGIQKK